MKDYEAIYNCLCGDKLWQEALHKKIEKSILSDIEKLVIKISERRNT